MKMRWIILNSILLISITLISAKDDHPKQKRDLAFVKNLISAFFGKSEPAVSSLPPVVLPTNGNTKIFRIPGFNKVLVRAVPKRTVATAAVPFPNQVIAQDPTIAIVGSYLGTKTPVDTLNALEGVNKLLSSGILKARSAVCQTSFMPCVSALREAEVLPPPVLAGSSINIGSEVRGNPFFVMPNIVERQGVAYEIPNPVIPLAPPPLPLYAPNIIQRIPMMQVPFPTLPLPTRFSYKQLHKNGAITSHTAFDNQNVIVTKSNAPLPLPPFLSQRIQQVANLGSVRMPVPMAVPLVREDVQVFDSAKVNPYRPVKPVQVLGNVNNFSYKQVHNDGAATAYSGSGQVGSSIRLATGVNPVIPPFISSRINKVVASAVSQTVPSRRVAQPLTSTSLNSVAQNPNINTKTQPKAQVENNINRNSNSQSPFKFSYKTIHKNGTVHSYSESGVAGQVGTNSVQPPIKPLSNTPFFGTKGKVQFTNAPYGSFPYQKIVKPPNVPAIPLAPALISSRITDIANAKKNSFRLENLSKVAKVNGNSFSYRIEHSDGSFTNYGPTEIKDNNKTQQDNNLNALSINFPNTNVPNKNNEQAIYNRFITKVLNNVAYMDHLFTNKNSAYSKKPFLYKTVHNDGSVTTFAKGEQNENIKDARDNQFRGSGNYGQQNLNGLQNNLASLKISTPSSTNDDQFSIENVKTSANNLPVTPVSIAAAGPNAVIFNKPIASSYMYKQISHSAEPNKFTVVHIEDPKRQQVVLDNVQFGGNDKSTLDSIPKDYVYIPPANAKAPLPTTVDKNSEKDYVYIPPTTAHVPLPIKPLENKSQEDSLSKNPIVVTDSDNPTYSFRQSNSDGSGIDVKGSKNDVSVNVQASPGRGDIPGATS